MIIIVIILKPKAYSDAAPQMLPNEELVQDRFHSATYLTKAVESFPHGTAKQTNIFFKDLVIPEHDIDAKTRPQKTQVFADDG